MPTSTVKGLVNMTPYPVRLLNFEPYDSPIVTEADSMSVAWCTNWAVPWCTGPWFERRHLRLIFDVPTITHPNKTIEYMIWQETRSDGDFIRFTLFPHQQQPLEGDFWTGYKSGARPLATRRGGYADPIYRDKEVVITVDERLWVMAYQVGTPF